MKHAHAAGVDCDGFSELLFDNVMETGLGIGRRVLDEMVLNRCDKLLPSGPVVTLNTTTVES